MPVDRGAALRAEGEVSERAELLNGTLQVVLDGRAPDAGVASHCASSVSWRLGRAGEVELDEGDLSLEGEGFALFGVLDHGTAVVDPDTGAARVRATFTIDDADDADGEVVVAGDLVRVDLHVEAETWSGEIHLAG